MGVIKEALAQKLIHILDFYKGAPWNEDLENAIRHDITTYLKGLGAVARELKIACADGLISVTCADYFKTADAN